MPKNKSKADSKKTQTDMRILISLVLPASIANILQEEVDHSAVSGAALIRSMVKWHRGISLGRHPHRAKVVLSKGTSNGRVTKGYLLDREDVDYLGQISLSFGVPRVTAMLLIILQWFDIDIVPAAGSARAMQ